MALSSGAQAFSRVTLGPKPTPVRAPVAAATRRRLHTAQAVRRERVEFEAGSDEDDDAAANAAAKQRKRPRTSDIVNHGRRQHERRRGGGDGALPALRYVEPLEEENDALRKTPVPRTKLNFFSSVQISVDARDALEQVRASILRGLGVACAPQLVASAAHDEPVAAAAAAAAVVESAPDAASATAGTSAARQICVDWSRRPPVPREVMERVKEQLGSDGFAGAPTAARQAAVDALLAGAGLRPLSAEALASIRQTLLLDKAVARHAVVQQRASDVARRYEAGEGVLAIAGSLDAPPVACMRVVLRARGLGKERMKKALRAGSSQVGDARDQRERDLACANDVCTGVDQAAQLADACAFERNLEALLRSRGVAFRTQGDLLSAQRAAKSAKDDKDDDATRSTLTPDILVDGALRINGREVRWMDAKNSFGGTSRTLTRKTHAQARKYVDEFGPGAIVYALGLAAPHTDEMGDDVCVLDFETLV